jgi:hypothetical protein
MSIFGLPVPVDEPLFFFLTSYRIRYAHTLFICGVFFFVQTVQRISAGCATFQLKLSRGVFLVEYMSAHLCRL